MGAVNGPPIPGSLRFLTGSLTGTICRLTKSVTRIGREPVNDIVVTDASVSRQHAEIIWSNGGWSIKKLTTHNVLTVNQQKIEQAIPINDGDTLGLGADVTLLFLTNVANGARPRQQ